MSVMTAGEVECGYRRAPRWDRRRILVALAAPAGWVIVAAGMALCFAAPDALTTWVMVASVVIGVAAGAVYQRWWAPRFGGGPPTVGIGLLFGVGGMLFTFATSRAPTLLACAVLGAGLGTAHIVVTNHIAGMLPMRRPFGRVSVSWALIFLIDYAVDYAVLSTREWRLASVLSLLVLIPLVVSSLLLLSLRRRHDARRSENAASPRVRVGAGVR